MEKKMKDGAYQPPNYNAWIAELHKICQKHIRGTEDEERMEWLIDAIGKGHKRLCWLAKMIVARVCPDPPQTDCDDIHVEPFPPGTTGVQQTDCDDIRTEPSGGRRGGGDI